MKRLWILTLTMVALVGWSGQTLVTAAPKQPMAGSVIRVNATVQAYDFGHPWGKKSPLTWRALGAVLPDHRVLVTAEMVANETFVELEKAESGEKTPAEVDCIDFQANLALLKPTDSKFLDGYKPFPLTPAVIGDHTSILQLEASGTLALTDALMTATLVARYPEESTALLTYRLTSALQTRDGSVTLPVVRNSRLIGMVMRYDHRTQNVDVIPAPVIEHFLKAAAKKPYRGFPRAGLQVSSARDPQLRRYVGVSPKISGGVYVNDVQKEFGADQGGLRVGDIVTAIDDQEIDQDGLYNDSLYGRMHFLHLIATRHFDGEKAKFTVARDGHTLSLEVPVRYRPPEDYVIEPFTINKAPSYQVVGGLVFIELSRSFLKEWGDDWSHKAPFRLVYFDRFQSELFPDQHRRLVVLSEVLPSPCTVGYEQLGSQVVTKINGVTINSLADVASAVAKPINGFHKIEFDESPRTIYLDARQVAAMEASILKNYGVPAAKR